MKRSKQRGLKRCISLLLIFALLCPLSEAYAVELKEAVSGTETAEPIITQPEEQPESLNIPDFITQEQIEAHEHIYRLPELEEANNTMVLQNRDGTISVYYTSQPLRYVDSSGAVQDIDLTLTQENRTWRTTANAVEVSFAQNYTEGISLDYKDTALRLVPVPNAASGSGSVETAPMVTAQATDSTLTYRNLFGAGIDVCYTPLYNGVKEDIILPSYTGVNAFRFLLYTGGMTLFEEAGSYYLAQTEDADERVLIGKVVAYDAQKRISEGSLSISPVKAGEIYQMTLSVDESFLEAEATSYPVVIDPSLIIWDAESGDGTVWDAPIYSGKPNINFGTYLYNGIGYADSSYQVGRTAIKLNGLINDPTYANLPASAITNAEFYIKDSYGASGRTVNLYAITGNSTWTETSLTWNNIGSVSSELQASATVGGEERSTFNITNLVRAWKNGTYNISCGFLLQSANESLGGNFYSTETAAANQPYAVITYETDGIDFSNATNMSLNTSYPVNLTTSGEKKYFKFTPSSTGFYTFESLSTISGNPAAWLYNASLTVLGYDNDSGQSGNFKLTYHLISGVTYYYSAGCYSSGTGSYQTRVTTASSPASMASTLLSPGDTKTVSLDFPYKVSCYRFTPTSDDQQVLFSANRTGDPEVWIYNAAGILVVNNDDSAGDYNFRLLENLTLNQTYYIVAGHHGANTGSYTIYSMYENLINRQYYIKNVGTKMFMDIEGPGTQEWVHQWSFHYGDQIKWFIEKQSDGYYVVRSAYGSMYYMGIASTTTGVDNIKLYETVSDNTRWKIYTNKAGEFVFVPKTATNKALCAYDSTSGNKLRLCDLGDIFGNGQWQIADCSSFTDYRSPSLSISIEPIGTLANGSEWHPLIQSAASSWNNSSAQTSIQITASSSVYTCEVDYYFYEWYGLMQPEVDENSIISSATIEINTRFLSDVASNDRIGTIAHEIGHLWGLEDNPDVNNPNESLMCYGANREVCYGPQAFDIFNVLFLYD